MVPAKYGQTTVTLIKVPVGTQCFMSDDISEASLENLLDALAMAHSVDDKYLQQLRGRFKIDHNLPSSKQTDFAKVENSKLKRLRD